MRGNRRRLVGTVVTIPGRKTVKVEVERRTQHPRYRKYITVSKKYMVHDEHEVCSIGDKVEIIEARPYSARKRFRLLKVLEKAALSADDLAAAVDEGLEGGEQ